MRTGSHDPTPRIHARSFLVGVLLFLAPAPGGAQTGPIPPGAEGHRAHRPACGTRPSEASAPLLLERATEPDGRDAPGTVFHVPIAFHVVRRTNGTGGISQQALQDSLRDANAIFAPAGIEFCPLPKTLFLDDSAYFSCVCDSKVESLRVEQPVADALNVYLVPTLRTDNQSLCGLGTLPGIGYPGVIVRNSCTAQGGDQTTLAHELGHFLGLLHTHESFFGVECADGSNCALSGDLVCDTPADPNLLGRVSAQCRYVGPTASPCPGDPTPLHPSVENVMSYAPPSCRVGFTPGQIERMRATLVSDRPELARLECPRPGSPSPRELLRVSQSAAGEPGNGPSRAPALAAKGGHVAFLSAATNLVPREVNGLPQVYVRDLGLRAPELVSRGPDGSPAEDACSSPRISADGRYVAYCTMSRNLVPEVHGPLPAGNVFRFDRENGETRLVSRAPDGGGSNAFFFDCTCTLSADGRFVAFTSYATNLVPIPELGVPQVYLADMRAGTVILVSAAPDGSPGNLYSESPAISPDGRYVAYSSSSSNLLPEDPDELADVFLFDRVTRTTRLLSVDEHGRKGFGQARTPSVSSGGRLVAFELAAVGPWKDDLTTIYGDIAVKDVLSGTLRRASETAGGRSTVFDCDAPSLSADGRHVAFRSRAREFQPVPTPLADYDVWIKDLASGALVEASVLDVESFGPVHPEVSIDARGSAVAFATEASNLVPDDTNGVADVYVRFLPR